MIVKNNVVKIELTCQTAIENALLEEHSRNYHQLEGVLYCCTRLLVALIKILCKRMISWLNCHYLLEDIPHQDIINRQIWSLSQKEKDYYIKQLRTFVLFLMLNVTYIAEEMIEKKTND